MPRKRCVAAARRGAPADAGRWQAGAAGPQPRPPAPQVVKLKAFSKFDNTAEALQAAASLVDSKMSKSEPGLAQLAQPRGGCQQGRGRPTEPGQDPTAPSNWSQLQPAAAGRCLVAQLPSPPPPPALPSPQA